MRDYLVLVPILLVVWTVFLFARLRNHRVDLSPTQHFAEGRSKIWQRNALDPRNYDARGKVLLRWLTVAQVLWMLSLIGGMVLLSRK